ncbi:uncharacterized protein [Montipora foliosa]|uniref:uncharacterized protein n=1 Tax=Montipora foliosa TaxID=591990 RepID=UPI0035F10B1B
MVHCIIVDCSSNSRKDTAIGFFRIPSIVDKQGEEAEELSRERRERWILAISRDDIQWKNVLKNERVFGRHFESGKPAAAWDRFNNNWVPTLNLGKTKYRKVNHEAVEARAARSKERRKRSLERLEYEAAFKRQQLDASGLALENIDFGEDPSTEQNVGEENQASNLCSSCDHGDSMSCSVSQTDSCRVHSVQTENEDCQTTSSMSQTEEFEYMFSGSGYRPPTQDYFNTDEKVRFYTGLPSTEILLTVLDHVSTSITRRSQTISKFQEFIMVLMKLRLNIPFQELAYRFQVSLPTVSRLFSSWLTVMDSRLSPLIYWPDINQLWETMPMCFQQAFGKKVTVVIDCFEVFIDRPTNLLARPQTFSSYKHHNTIKVLIGITPQGTISFISRAWGGRTSDKYLTENCGLLDKLMPGDMIMADRGFTIAESVGLKQAKLVIPAFTKGKTQLDPVDVEKTRGIASIRIHVERVIGLLRHKYTILQSTLPTDFLICSESGPPDSKVPLIDRIIRVCSALVNLCPPIIPFD